MTKEQKEAWGLMIAGIGVILILSTGSEIALAGGLLIGMAAPIYFI